jgi:hypothetical protein
MSPSSQPRGESVKSGGGALTGRFDAPIGRRESVSKLQGKTLVTVLGMHRSGTSAVAGMIEEHGVGLGQVSKRTRFNARGNREIKELNKLHNGILARSGGSWWDPPRGLSMQPDDTRKRDAVLSAIPGDTIGVKDPRIVLLLDLWRDLDPKHIGVIRNPVAVRKSLERRARERGEPHPQLSPAGWEELWVIYNRALLDELERSSFPVIDFDRHFDLDAQVRAALTFHGLEASGNSRFFDRELVGQNVDEWRSQVISSVALDLWDELARRALE